MPSSFPRNRTKTQLDNHSVEIQTKTNKAAAVYFFLNTYDYDPVAAANPMIAYSWKIPTNQKTIEYNPSFGEMYYNGTGYSSLGSEDKVIFWQWIDKFVTACLKNYDKNYGF